MYVVSYYYTVHGPSGEFERLLNNANDIAMHYGMHSWSLSRLRDGSPKYGCASLSAAICQHAGQYELYCERDVFASRCNFGCVMQQLDSDPTIANLHSELMKLLAGTPILRSEFEEVLFGKP